MQEITNLETKSLNLNSDFVEIKEDKVYTTSRIVAEKFGKEHYHVLEAIEEKMKFTAPNFRVSENFVLGSYVDSKGRTLKQYLITEEGAMLLIMGFTGEKAFAVQTKFISEFKRMSRIINNPAEVIAETGSPEAVLAFGLANHRFTNAILAQMKENKALTSEVKQLTSTVKTQNVQIAEMQPKVQYCDIVLSCPDLVTVTVIAKDYGKSAMWLNNYLKDKKIIFKQGDIWLPYQKYAKLGLTKTKTATYKDNNGNEHAKTHSCWTQKGRLFIYDLLKQDNIFPLIEQE